jgi:RNA recognition motif-containing protein
MSTEQEVISVKPVIDERIYISNVDYKATEEELKELFKDLKVYV